MVVSSAVRQMRPAGSFLLACVGGALLFLGTTAPQFASAATTTSSSESPTPSPSVFGSPSFCETEEDTCLADSDCRTCITEWGAEYASSSECQDVRYPVTTSATTCESLASDFCCNLGDESATEACMTDELFTSYWACFMGDLSCSIEDMPCYASGNSSTTSTSDASASRDIVITSSASEDDTVAAICADEAEVCLEDEVCEGCYSDAEEAADPGDYTFCQLGYLDLEGESPATTTSSLPGVCALIGAEYCCRNDFSTGDCLADGASVGYWSCVFDYYECSMDEMPCFSDSDSFRTDDDASAASNSTSSDATDSAADDAGATSDNGAVGLSTQPGSVSAAYAWTIFAGLAVGVAVNSVAQQW